MRRHFKKHASNVKKIKASVHSSISDFRHFYAGATDEHLIECQTRLFLEIGMSESEFKIENVDINPGLHDLNREMNQGEKQNNFIPTHFDLDSK